MFTRGQCSIHQTTTFKKRNHRQTRYEHTKCPAGSLVFSILPTNRGLILWLKPLLTGLETEAHRGQERGALLCGGLHQLTADWSSREHACCFSLMPQAKSQHVIFSDCDALNTFRAVRVAVYHKAEPHGAWPFMDIWGWKHLAAPLCTLCRIIKAGRSVKLCMVSLLRDKALWSRCDRLWVIHQSIPTEGWFTGKVYNDFALNYAFHNVLIIWMYCVIVLCYSVKIFTFKEFFLKVILHWPLLLVESTK